MAFFQRAAGYNLQRLTKLYQDTKQSYESNKPTAASIHDDPEVKELRRDFQIQQDRLLAWGMHWADVEAQYGGGSQQSQEQDIDKKIDQAGLGEVVASVMSQIKSLLDESGRLQHPGRFEASRQGGGGGRGEKRTEWTKHEVQTGRVLLARLTECIDLLYSLSDGRREEEKGEKSEKAELKKEKSSHGLEDDVEAALYGQRERHTSAFGRISDHPLHIEFSQIDFQNNHGQEMADPPPYGAADTVVQARDRLVGYWRNAKKPVLIDFLNAQCSPQVVGTSEDVFELHELGEKLSKHHKDLSWYGHLRLLGFTVEAYRCGMVYELPADRSQQTLSKHQTLAATINATCNQEMARPPLEDRFRLAYNIILSVLGYFANGDSHRHVNANNVLLISKDGERPQFSAGAIIKPDIRPGFLLQSCQDFIARIQTPESLEAEMYLHPGHDVSQPDTVVPAYDIYSLGLVLLEIGLWVPLTRMWKSDYDRRIFMVRVQRMYSQKLASKMGSKYMRLVQRCLHAPVELFGRDRPHEAAAHLLEVAKELRLCLALDEEGMPPGEDIECFELLIIEQMCKTDNIGAPPLPSSLPPLKIPGAYSEEQETGITKPDYKVIKRKMLPPPDLAPAQPQRRPSKHQRRRSAAAGLHKWPEMQIPQSDLDLWNTLLMPKLSKILSEALQDSPESASVSLMKIGATAEAAKTTICIQCANTQRVHEALRKRFRPKKGWGVVILKGDVRRSASGPRRSRKPRRSIGKPGDAKSTEQKYQEKPSCGASIGAFRDNEHLPPVSFGGTILVDGEPFGMTVHHMLDAPSDSEDDDYSDEEEGLPKRSAATRAAQDSALNHMGTSQDLSFMGSDTSLHNLSSLEISDEDFSLSDADSASNASTIRPDYSITDDSGHEFWFLDDSSDTASSAPDLIDDDAHSSSSSDDEDDAASIGDKPAILPYTLECDELAVTQPAIDDVDQDFFVGDSDDRDEDHLSSHTFGFVHASSGIRRVMRGQLKHEVDWALIRIDDDRLDANNQLHSVHPRRPVRGQRRDEKALPSLPTLTKVVPSTKLSNLPVACRARSSGFSSGKISAAMCLVKLHGRHTFSYSWAVDSTPSPPTRHTSSCRGRQARPKPDLGIPGDSGAWIYCPSTGELAGHVLAFSEKLKQCYIAPMEVLFEDISARLGASRVELPGALAAAVVQGQSEREAVEDARGREIEDRQDSGIGLDQEVEMGLREIRLEERMARDGRKEATVQVGAVPEVAGTVS